jgi:hypothetical protein
METPSAALARGCSLTSLGGWPEMEGGAALCRPARNAPERLQGVAGVVHRYRRSRLEFHVKAGNAGEVARLMDEGGEEAWLGWAPAAPPRAEGGGGGGGGGVRRARRMRWPLFDLPWEAARHDWPVWPPRGHDAAAETLRLRAPEGSRWPPPQRAYGEADCGPRIEGSLAAWRAANPDAEVAHVMFRHDLTDADFVHLAGVGALLMPGCSGITDAGLAHLAGIRMLDMSDCSGITDAGLAHLAGIHALHMYGCRRITDAGLAHLTGIHTLNMSSCTGITDAGLAHLTGIHTLNMGGCPGITDAGLAHLTGIHTLRIMMCTGITDAGLAHLTSIDTLDMSGCTGITDAGLAHLCGIGTLDMSGCSGITDAGLAHLAGIHTLSMRGCAHATVTAARARGFRRGYLVNA